MDLLSVCQSRSSYFLQELPLAVLYLNVAVSSCQHANKLPQHALQHLNFLRKHPLHYLSTGDSVLSCRSALHPKTANKMQTGLHALLVNQAASPALVSFLSLAGFQRGWGIRLPPPLQTQRAIQRQSPVLRQNRPGYLLLAERLLTYLTAPRC